MVARTCPICKREVPAGAESRRFRPFCSKRCADIDLSRWLRGTYAIPSSEEDDATGAENVHEMDAETDSTVPSSRLRH